MSNEIQVFIDRISKWINKKVNKYISMMIKYTEKLETNIKSKLHEGTKWIHKTKQKNCIAKLLHKKYPVLRFESSPLTAAGDSPLISIAPIHSQCSCPVSYAIR